jgi:hypothetical protein
VCACVCACQHLFWLTLTPQIHGSVNKVDYLTSTEESNESEGVDWWKRCFRDTYFKVSSPRTAIAGSFERGGTASAVVLVFCDFRGLRTDIRVPLEVFPCQVVHG